MKLLLYIFCLIVLLGCHRAEREQAQSGRAEYQRTVMSLDIAGQPVEVNESFSFWPPEADAAGSSFRFGAPWEWHEGMAPATGSPISFDGTFGMQYRPADPPSAGGTWGQIALYAAGIVCIGLGGVLIGGPWKHLKLGGISGAVGIGLIGIAVSIEKFPWIWAYVTGAGVISVGAFVGWNLWQDYKERNQND